MSQTNPFIPPGREYGSVDTESRLRALEDFDLEQCRAALALPGLQKTVEKKLRSRIRALEKLANTDKPAEGAQEERERFETWASEHFFSSCFEQFDGKYASRALQAAWELWQTRCAMAQPSPVPVPVPVPVPELERFAPVMHGTTACMERVAAGGYVRTRDHLRVEQERDQLRARLAELEHKLKGQWTYASDQATHCAGCGKLKHTPLRVDWMGGYVCLTCIDEKLEALHEAIQAGQVPEECPHLILFDDADVKPIMFAGSGARRAALAKWEQVSINWNAHLFVRIEKNCRDDRYPCATLASTPEQGGE